MSNRPLAYEDLQPGMEIAMGPYPVTAGEIIEFASEFDPQPMHLDEEAGKASMLGGLAASGWHTVSIAMRMMCDAYLLGSTSQGAPGVDYVKWRRPVLAGDTLTGKSIIKDRRVSGSRPGLGFVSVEHRLFNQRGECVCEMANTGMFLLRDPEAA
ncbi:MAG: MaoC family dehydratase [Notoacmeibacter sp.]|nr:MaoC family dehydratase [Notoacmeibacter sp.]